MIIEPKLWNVGEQIHIDMQIGSPTGETGEAANIDLHIQRASDSLYWDGDSWEGARTALNPFEVDATNERGHYRYTLSAAGNSQADHYTAFVHWDPGDGFEYDALAIHRSGTPVSSLSVVTLTVDDGVDPIANVNVTIQTTAGVALVTGTTNASGQLVVALFDGSYQVALYKDGVSFTVPETLTVSGATSDTYSGTVYSPTAPSAPELCTVYGTVVGATGQPVDGVTLSFFATTPQGIDGNLLTRTKTDVVTGAGAWAIGYFEIELPRTAQIRLRSNVAGLEDLVITIPDAASALFATLVEAAS